MWLGTGLTFFLPWRAWDSGMLSLPMQTLTAAACAKLQRLAAAESALPRLARHRRGETIDQHLPIICVFVSFTITNYEFTSLVSSLVGLMGPLRLGFCYYVLRVTGIGDPFPRRWHSRRSTGRTPTVVNRHVRGMRTAHFVSWKSFYRSLWLSLWLFEASDYHILFFVK